MLFLTTREFLPVHETGTLDYTRYMFSYPSPDISFILKATKFGGSPTFFIFSLSMLLAQRKTDFEFNATYLKCLYLSLELTFSCFRKSISLAKLKLLQAGNPKASRSQKGSQLQNLCHEPFYLSHIFIKTICQGYLRLNPHNGFLVFLWTGIVSSIQLT